ncbi:MAG: 50S ribosomal protein L4 [Parachlamydia sp.]|nr:50S ribosomal protein L4 [Parachlamydia sp.]
MKKYSLKGEHTGHVEASKGLKALIDAEANGQMIKDYIVAIRANARQWSASTKGRSEVSHSTKKPHPQKGGGRSRQGSLAAPQYKGGGRVFTPRPKFDQHVRINKKERRAAIRCLLGEKIREKRMHVIESTSLDAPHTKTVANFIDACKLGKRVLFLGESNIAEFDVEGGKKQVNIKTSQHENFAKSLRNIPKTEFALATNISGYDVVVAHDIVLTEAALEELINWLV